LEQTIDPRDPFRGFIERMRPKAVADEYPEPTYDPFGSDDDVAPTPARPPFEYISGPAGTGKTFTAAQIASDDVGALLTCTTGIAAINLGGTTINSALGYFDTKSMADAYTSGWLQSKMAKLAEKAGITRYILDEVSMLDAEQLTILCAVIDEVNDRQRRLNEPDIGLTLVGDFAQLPPVKGQFAFQSPEWKRFEGNITRLTKVYRQDSQDFIAALGAVRRGHAQVALDYFGPHLEPQIDDRFDGTTIMAKNLEVDRFNHLRLAGCRGKELVFPSVRDGKLRGEWKNVPEVLPLKEGALVMVLANRKSEFGGFVYVNGDLGTLVGKTETKDDEGNPRTFATVKLSRGQTVNVDMVRRENIVPMEPGRRKELKEADMEAAIRGKSEVVGWIEYMPLRLAWATTVHKAQGLSLDKVQVNIRDHFFTHGGMLYVALSRARTMEGLRLVGRPEQFVLRCRPDVRVKAWL
jgi:ATP-dependent DNA helicase PIF1